MTHNLVIASKNRSESYEHPCIVTLVLLLIFDEEVTGFRRIWFREVTENLL